MIIGVNGGGKTTTLGKSHWSKWTLEILVSNNSKAISLGMAGKLANRFKKEGTKVMHWVYSYYLKRENCSFNLHA